MAEGLDKRCDRSHRYLHLVGELQPQRFIRYQMLVPFYRESELQPMLSQSEVMAKPIGLSTFTQWRALGEICSTEGPTHFQDPISQEAMAVK